VKDIGLLEPWKQVKQRMGPDRFLEFIQDKERRFYKAHRRHHEGKPIRKAKRAMKRSKLKKRTRPVVEDGDSEDDTPLIQTKRAGLPNSNRRKDTITPSQASWNSLFVDSQDPNPLGPPSQEQGEGALFVTQSPVTRKAPLEQSSSEDEGETSVDSNSDDSLMGELAARGQRKTHKKTTRKTRANEGPDLGRSILSPKSPTEKQPVPPAKSALKKPVAREQHEGKVPNPIRKPTIPVAAMIPKVVESRKQTAHPSGPAAQASSAAPRKKSVGTLNRPESSATASARAPAMTVQPGSNALTRLPPKATSATAIRKTGSSSKSAINFTNEPKTSTRSEWQNGNGLFKKWSSKHRANVRGHVEAAPDFCSLEFVNHAPVGLVKSRSTNAADNPYGRRETGNRRVPEVDRYEPGRRGSADDVVPLQDWEANKAPLVCSEWRLSNNCQYGPVKCQFMHRNKDEHGKNLPLSLDGLPPKYRKPPLTCFFWMTSEQGCRKGAEECVYAHRNTGWMPKSESDKETSKIDPNDLPVSELQASTLTPHSRAVVAKDRRGLKPKELTCWYWTKGSCNKTPEACIHAHYDTGVIAKPPATATTTCEFWRKGYCRKTAAQCKYMHAEKEGQISANAGPFAVC
jgi:chromo domain-containing protein 1